MREAGSTCHKLLSIERERRRWLNRIYTESGRNQNLITNLAIIPMNHQRWCQFGRNRIASDILVCNIEIWQSWESVKRISWASVEWSRMKSMWTKKKFCPLTQTLSKSFVNFFLFKSRNYRIFDYELIVSSFERFKNKSSEEVHQKKLIASRKCSNFMGHVSNRNFWSSEIQAFESRRLRPEVHTLTKRTSWWERYGKNGKQIELILADDKPHAGNQTKHTNI